MAEIALSILGPVIEVVKWVAAPVKRQLSYLCCFTCYVAALKDEAKNLDYQTGDLQERVDIDKNNAREIYEIVNDWLAASGDMTRAKERILAEATEVGLGSGCFNYAKRVSLTKEAKKTAEAMQDLIQRCEFDSISRSPPIAASSDVPFEKPIHDFNSRKRFEEDIVTSLNRDNKVDKVGVWGIGGVGKTVVAQKILNRALKEGLFDEVVMVTVSQPVDKLVIQEKSAHKLVIQKKIAEKLGLTLTQETLEGRADTLRTRLRQKKRSLILLDDVWETLNLEELGIPCDGEWSTIIVTSRNKDVLKGMKIENICELGVLHEDEAWDFFKKMAGTCVDDVILKSMAYEVMKECKGLLVALESVGKAHEDEKHPDVWRDSLRQLRKHNPVDIPNVIEKVYKPLKLSYERLESKNAQSLFLLCCLFAEDADIPLERLAYFAIGLRLFDGIWELEEVRDRICRSIETLKNRCLLLDSSKEDHVCMHDVVRDVSIFIASEERRVNCNDCTWISSYMDGGARPPHSCFPKLKLLFVYDYVDKRFEIVQHVVEGRTLWLEHFKYIMTSEMEVNIGNLIGGSTELNVLFIERGLLKSLPLHTPQSLKTTLTTLVLRDCESLESIAVVGKLHCLEILICTSCKSIKEFPEQVRGLKRLKLLEISYCGNLERVAAGVISSMVALEELKFLRSFGNWEGLETEDGKETTRNAGLREIESLKKLRCLDIQVFDNALVDQPLCLSSTLVRFNVQFGKVPAHYEDSHGRSNERSVSLNFRDKCDINWGVLSTNSLVTRSECLYASADKIQDFGLNLETAQSIRWLSLKGFMNKKNITSAAASFPLLESLSLERLENIEEIWDEDAPIPSNSFRILTQLRLFYLFALKRMGKIVLPAAKDFFLQLESIVIVCCYEMEHLLAVVPNEDKGNHISTELIFPKLKTLKLSHLGKLRSMICSEGIESIQFPLLAKMLIRECGNFRRISDDHDCEDDDSLHLFCDPKVSIPNLKILTLRCKMEIKNVWCDRVPIGFFTQLVELNVYNCDKIKRLFSSSKIPQNLVNLQMLQIKACSEMVKVIEDDEEVPSSSSSLDCTTKHTSPLFPSLQHITLWYLHKLESFCEWRCALELPSLKILEINGCDEMKSFNAAGSVIITATITVEHEKLESVDVLNATLHQHVEKIKRWREERENEKEEERRRRMNEKKKKKEKEVERAMDERVK